MKKQINMIMALIMAITSLSGCATATSSMSIDSVSAGNEVNEALMGEVTNIDLKEISIGAGLFLRDGVEGENKALIIEETAPVVTTTTTLGEENVTEFEETTITTVPQTEISVVTDNEGQTVTDSKGEVVTSIVTNNNYDYDYDHDSDNNRPAVTTIPTNPTTTKSTTVTTTPTTTKATTTTTTTPVTTKATTTTTTTTPVVTEPPTPDREEEFGVDWEIAERAKNYVVDSYNGNDDTEYAESLFLDVMNSYRVNHSMEAVHFGSEHQAWQTYFSDRFLRHLDRNDVIMHSVLGSRGVCGTTEIITVQKNSMTVWEAFSSFMHSPDHRSAIDDPDFNGVGVVITFFEGSYEQGYNNNYDNHNNVYCLVNFRAGASLGDGWYDTDIEDFEAFLSSEIRLDCFNAYAGDAGEAKVKTNIDFYTYKMDGMRRTKLILDYSLNDTRLNSWWDSNVENAANIIFDGFSDALNYGQNENGLYGKDTDEALEQYLDYLADPWSCLN